MANIPMTKPDHAMAPADPVGPSAQVDVPAQASVTVRRTGLTPSDVSSVLQAFDPLKSAIQAVEISSGGKTFLALMVAPTSQEAG